MVICSMYLLHFQVHTQFSISEDMGFHILNLKIVFIQDCCKLKIKLKWKIELGALESAALDKVCLIFQFHYPRLVPRCSE